MKRLHQQYAELDNLVIEDFLNSFNITWEKDYKDNSSDEFCEIDLQLTGTTKSSRKTYDCEIKAVHLKKWLDYCFLEPSKWLGLCSFDNDIKLYIVIYPNLDKIAIWELNKELLMNSDKDLILVRKDTCNGLEFIEKEVYKLEVDKAKVFNVNLSQYKPIYNALLMQRPYQSPT